MTITKFEFEDTNEKWRLSKTLFDNRLTLLVGASGVGKTLILRSLIQIKQIVRGDSIKGLKWAIEFSPDEERSYHWEGAFQNKGTSLPKRNRSEIESLDSIAKIEYERLSIDGKLLIERDAQKIFFNGKLMPKLSQGESILSLFMEEDSIKPAHECLSKITFLDHSDSPHSRYEYYTHNILHKDNGNEILALSDLRKSSLPTIIKLHLLEKIDKNYFDQIKRHFIGIFPQVNDIRSAPLDEAEEEVPALFKEALFVQIKENDVDHWIWEQRISSGMLRVLLELCDIYLCPEGTIFLIDEFENSLGVNCIKEITDEILSQDRPLQFIITSHHPYIINNVDTAYWKLVTRNGGNVKTKSLQDLGLDFASSHHETFMQLLQLEEYQTGQEQKR